MSLVKSTAKPWSPNANTVWWLIGISLGLHLIIFLLGSTILKAWRHEHLPMHSLVEALGGAIALLVAFKLISLNKHGAGPKYAVRIAHALIVMGLMDGLHAASHLGNNFVWLHSVATFFGGLFFALIIIPERYLPPPKQSFGVVIVIFFLGLSSFVFPEFAPTMIVIDGSFSFAASLLNLLGGIFLILAAARLVMEFRATNSVNDLLFSMHCLLFGLAALLFHSSELWDASWWGWHFLRLLAYFVALVFVILSEEDLLQKFGNYGSEMNQLAYTDSLTKSHNRRSFDEQLVYAYIHANRFGTNLSVAFLDIDHFKAVNDEYGHDEGDKVLIAITECISKHLRENDRLARIGGEEFALILPSTSKDNALHLVERIRKGLETAPIYIKNKEIHVTASFGIAELTARELSEKALLKNADHALYAAKQKGRNQTVVYTHENPPSPMDDP